MAGAFQRLIARATGAPTTGLRPQLPSLFETSGGHVGFEEIQQDTPVRSPATAQSQPSVAPSDPASMPQTTINSEPGAVAAKAPAAAPDPRDAQTSAPQSRSLPAQSKQQHPLQDHVQPAPLLSKHSPNTARTTTRSAVTSPPLKTEADQGADRPHTDTPYEATPPPPPLLETTTPDATGNVETREAPTAPYPTAASNAAANTEAAAPEITIHIGQLDIRSEQPQPVAPQRPAPRTRNLPSLSDYLRGRGS